MANINLCARLKVRAGSEETVKAAAVAIVGPSRAEEGCVSYDVHQAIDDPTVFCWYETWTDQAALDAHFEFEYFKEFFAVAGSHAEEPPVITVVTKLT